MKEASSKLRKFRQSEDPGGGVSYEKPCKKPADGKPPLPPMQPCEKSGAALSYKLPVVLLAVLAAMMASA